MFKKTADLEDEGTPNQHNDKKKYMKIKIYFTAALSEPESQTLHKLVTKVT